MQNARILVLLAHAPVHRSACHQPTFASVTHKRSRAAFDVLRPSYQQTSVTKSHPGASQPTLLSASCTWRCRPQASASGAGPAAAPSPSATRWAALRTFLFNQYVPIGLVLAILAGCAAWCTAHGTMLKRNATGPLHPPPVPMPQNTVYYALRPPEFSSYLDSASSVVRRSKLWPRGGRCPTAWWRSCSSRPCSACWRCACHCNLQSL